jgi:hypothetical protein
MRFARRLPLRLHLGLTGHFPYSLLRGGMLLVFGVPPGSRKDRYATRDTLIAAVLRWSQEATIPCTIE